MDVDAIDDAEDAIDAFTQALKGHNFDNDVELRADVLTRKAKLLVRVGRFEEAVREIDKVLAAGAHSADAHWLKGHALQRRRMDRKFNSFGVGNDGGPQKETEGGRDTLDSVIDSYRRALDIEPMHPRALHAMSMLVKPEFPDANADPSVWRPTGAWRIDSHTLERMRVLDEMVRANASAGDPESAFTHFALFNMYVHDESRRDLRWSHLSHGNAILSAHQQYIAERDVEYVHGIMDAFQPDFLLGGADGAADGSGGHPAAPIFLVGMPFSGIGLVEAVLALSTSNPGVLSSISTTIGDSNVGHSPFDISTTVHATLLGHLNSSTELYVSKARLRAVADEYLRKCHSRAGFAYGGGRGEAPHRRIVDGSFYNIYNLGYIALLFPNARIIHVARDPIQNLIQLFEHVFDTEYFPIANGWSSDQHALARKYELYAELIRFWRSRLPDGMMYEVAYEDLVLSTFDSGMTAVLEFAGLEWDDAASDFFRQQQAVQSHNNVVDRRNEHEGSVHDGHKHVFRELVRALGEDVRHLIPSEYRRDARDVFREDDLYVGEVANMTAFGAYVSAAMQRNSV